MPEEKAISDEALLLLPGATSLAPREGAPIDFETRFQLDTCASDSASEYCDTQHHTRATATRGAAT